MWDNFPEKFIYVLTNYSGPLMNGLTNTLLIAASAFVIGILLGTVIAIIRVMPKRNAFVYVLDKICAVYVTIIRGTPIVVQLLLMYFAILAPLRIPAVIVAILVFGLNSSAYMSEIMRAGIQSIEKGQMEAGRSLGMSYAATMIKIIIPQAIKNIIPTIANEFIALLKETSVAGYITVIDVTFAVQRIVAKEYTALAPYMVLALIYLVTVTILAGLIKLVERRLRKSERRS